MRTFGMRRPGGDRASLTDPTKVTVSQLIALRAAGESLPLRSGPIRARQSGQYLSAFKGRGMEFDEVRPYQPGDDVRTIDWRVTARSGHPHTKLFREERECPVLFWLDLSNSMFFATRRAYKAVLAAETTALLAWHALHSGDRLGGVIFTPEASRILRPARGKVAVTGLIGEICRHPVWAGTEKVPANGTVRDHFAPLTRLVKPGGRLFILSDFRTLSEHDLQLLRRLAAHSELILAHIFDPVEQELPPPGHYLLRDRDATFCLDSTRSTTRAAFRARFDERQHTLEHFCRSHDALYLPLSTAVAPAESLHRLLHRGKR